MASHHAPRAKLGKKRKFGTNSFGNTMCKNPPMRDKND